MTIYFDITDLFSFLENSPMVSGIQRVQVEAIRAQGANVGDQEVRCARFCEDHVWRSASLQPFCDLFRRAEKRPDDWKQDFADFTTELMESPPTAFAKDDILYLLGASWSVSGIFESLRAIRRDGARCVFFIHDIIPVLHPEYFERHLSIDFSFWLANVLFVADAIVCNSEATRTDFLENTGYTRPCAVANLNIRPRFVDEELEAPAPVDGAPQGAPHGVRELEDRPFVLMVGTVEPRKNHITAINVWKYLAHRFGKDCPRLAIVGRVGWNSDGIIQHMEMMNDGGDIVHLTKVSDAQLAALYRGCLFTIYLSRYEGWGLPVTESLAFGRLCVTGENSSLLEPGQGVTIHVDDRSERDIAQALSELVERPSLIAEKETEIQQKVVFKTWSKFLREVRSIEADLEGPVAAKTPVVVPGKSYWFGRKQRMSDLKDAFPGEVLRDGPGWYLPEPWGSWSSAKNSLLRFSVAEAGDYDCYAVIVGPPGGGRLKLTSGRRVLWEGDVAGRKLINGPLGWVKAGAQIRLSLESSRQIDLSRDPNTNDARILACGWIELLLVESGDDAARIKALEHFLSVYLG
jgi:glycosyltransferase involved in cell wall biosynthesis